MDDPKSTKIGRSLWNFNSCWSESILSGANAPGVSRGDPGAAPPCAPRPLRGGSALWISEEGGSHGLHRPLASDSMGAINTGREAGYVVELERFQGPLDLLLHLIRQQEMDIFDIPIAVITDQFLRAIQSLGPEDLDSAGEFLEMAATLVRIKAQFLLPRPEMEQGDDPRAELVRRLLEYEQVREVALRLSQAEAYRSRCYARGFVPPRQVTPDESIPLETSWQEVWVAALGVTLPEPRKDEHRVTPRTISMDARVALILDRLSRVTSLAFRSLMSPGEGKMHGVMTFLAGLELTRRRAIRLRQRAPFQELWFLRRDDPPEANEDVDAR